MFLITYLIIEDKITKKRCNEKIFKQKIIVFKLFLVISPHENEKFNK